MNSENPPPRGPEHPPPHQGYAGTPGDPGHPPPLPPQTPPPAPPRPRGPQPPPPGVEYHRVLASDKRRVGRGIAALVLLLGGMLVFALALGAVASVIEMAFGLDDPDATPQEAALTPVQLGAGLFSLALLIPWSMLIQRWLYKVEGASLHSVRSLFRFDLMGRSLVILLPVWAVYMGVFTQLMPYDTVPWTTFDLFLMFMVIVVFTPLQSAGEEYGFRGLAFRIAASWGRGPGAALTLGVVVSSLVFMLVHLAADPWLNLYYFVLGATLAIITWRTGGLEIAVVVHAVNNTIAFLLVVVTRTDLAEGMDRSVGAGSPAMLLPCVLMLAITAVVWWRTRRSGPALTAGQQPPA
ncbi:CPBP family intramembrane metalloprotease [Nocardiopsis sp. HNM0947]|uniref:CPBP family intramembrane metalloprotease n=1 Tax=Nocardiopsis coralli TaxID=2772213 RepID=A0ABR9PB01_9ACTN|nr:CPBP family intramembrane glutamic endopeptidase [Nocardiopsis coralli]MBE3001012.1 CPBP family intramembrane metalloprotease [Nocardiopsis coralli]